jgi:murein DD-endopeptidase MepM/ murein hydrolase activator NlpD
VSSQKEENSVDSYKLLEDSIGGLLEWVSNSHTIRSHTKVVDTVVSPQSMGVTALPMKSVVRSLSTALVGSSRVAEYSKNLRYYIISIATWVWYALNTLAYKAYIAATELVELAQTLPRRARKTLSSIHELAFILQSKDLRELIFIEWKLSLKLFAKQLENWVTSIVGLSQKYYLAFIIIGSLLTLGLSTVAGGNISFLQTVSSRHALATAVPQYGVGGSSLLSRDILKLRRSLPRSFILEHTVEQGQTVAYLSKLYGVAEDTIRFNNTITGDALDVGAKMYIPPINSYLKITDKEERIADIARVYKVDEKDLVAYNPDLIATEVVQSGKVVLVPLSDFGLVKQYQDEEATRLKEEARKTEAAQFRVQALAGVAYKKLDFLDSNRVADLDFGLPVDEAYNRATTYWGHVNNAVDFGGGTSNPPIYAAAAGIVVEVQTGFADVSCVGSAGCFQNGYANYVTIDHGGGYKTRYAHLRSVNVQIGQKVTKGEMIGLMGQAGYAFGIHLHFEVLKDGYGVFPPYVIPAIKM